MSNAVALDFQSLDYTYYKTNQQHGVIFRAVHDNFLLTDSYLALVFKILFLELPVMPLVDTIDPGICQCNFSVAQWQVCQALFMNKVKEEDYFTARLVKYYDPRSHPFTR